MARTVDVQSPVQVACMTAALVAFFGLLRKSNLTTGRRAGTCDMKSLHHNNITKNSATELWLTLNFTKTIQFGERTLNIPIIGIDGSVINPAAWWTLHNQLSPAPTPNTHAFAHRDASGTMTNLTHTTFVSFTKTMIQTSGLGDPAQFSGHSYRRGGATFAAACGAPDAWIKAAGDWTSSAYLRYVEISTGLRQSLATKVASEAASRRQ